MLDSLYFRTYHETVSSFDANFTHSAKSSHKPL